jgi:epoxyqueuosine reductase
MKPCDSTENGLEWIRRELTEFVDTWKSSAKVDFWSEPIVACASAHDPLLSRLKEVIDPAHAMPRDILPEAESVIVFFLPFRPEFGRENDNAGFNCSRNWGVLYYTTNDLILAVNEHLQRCLENAGHKARITPATHNFDERKLISLWSHKHLGYIAGLGTFGRHHLLITQSGCCGRLGSLVTSMHLLPTPRPDREYCLDKSGRECLGCVSKCIYGGLREDGYDRHACYAQCLTNDSHFNDLPLVDVCGKCACEVPCSYTAS